MILALDVQYGDTGARAAGILFAQWGDAQPAREIVVEIAEVADYVPGQFYRRELPCLQAVLARVTEPLEAIIIDGYVQLGPEAAPGLGQHLWEALDRQIPVIGVAKTPFRGTPETAQLLRGGSTRPLYVTAAGITQEAAKSRIAAMAGDHRLPDLLKQADRLCRREP